MSRLLETIRFQNGKAVRPEYHERRMAESLSAFFPGHPGFKLSSLPDCPDACKNGRTKCRVVYSDTIESVTFEPYFPRIIRNLKCIESSNISYAHKYADRSALDALKNGIWDDDILLCRNGFLMDVSFANIILLKDDKWYTPQVPLLKGTRRQHLLDSGFVQTRMISLEQLNEFQELRIINAMLDPYDLPAIPVHEIRF